LYVVDTRQAFHFQNFFEAARRSGYDKVQLEHVSFGSVLGEDGKPLKTREGAVLKLKEEALNRLAKDKVPAPVIAKLSPMLEREVKEEEAFLGMLRQALSNDEVVRYGSRILRHARGGAVELRLLLDEAVERARDIVDTNSPHLAEQERLKVADAVGVGAVKYADLSQNRTSDYVFGWDKMIAMSGNTATYMQYAYARNCSILAKSGEDVTRFRTAPPPVLLDTPFERALALALLRLEEALSEAAAEYQPSAITSYLWDLAKAYSAFNQNC